jgi:hypothetical protein
MSIRFAESFVGAILCQRVHWMGSLSEEGGDGGCVSRKGCVFRRSEVHAVLPYLSLYHSDA